METVFQYDIVGAPATVVASLVASSARRTSARRSASSIASDPLLRKAKWE